MIITHPWDTNTALVCVVNDLNGVVPTEIQVIPYAINQQTPQGIFTCDEGCQSIIISEFITHINDMVIDYEHQTLMNVEAPAAGWGKRENLFSKGKEGLWLRNVDWTSKARNYIANKEYRFVSPVFLKRLSDDRVVRLINVALTNQPNIDGMVPITNKYVYDLTTAKEEKPMWKELMKRLGLTETATEQDAIVAINKLADPVRILANKSVLAALGLTETATENDAIAAIKKLAESVRIVANKSVLTALGLTESATEAEITGTIMAMKQSHTQVGDLATQVKKLQDKLNASAASDAVAVAMKDGKITPAQKEWADEYAKRDLEGFKVFVAKAPVVVVLGKVVGEDKPADGAIDDVQMQINKMCGVDAETFKKYNKEA